MGAARACAHVDNAYVCLRKHSNQRRKFTKLYAERLNSFTRHVRIAMFVSVCSEPLLQVYHLPLVQVQLELKSMTSGFETVYVCSHSRAISFGCLTRNPNDSYRSLHRFDQLLVDVSMQRARTERRRTGQVLSEH